MLVLQDFENYWGLHLTAQHVCLTVMLFSLHAVNAADLLWEARSRLKAPQSCSAN